MAQGGRQLRARAASTPLLVGDKGSPLELVLSSLHFGKGAPGRIPWAEVARVKDTGLAQAIPLYVRFRAGDDPIVGVKVRQPITQNLHLDLWGDVGGFGVESDFTWSATGVLGYDFEMFSIHSTVYGGYRAIGWDYQQGHGRDRFEWDVILHGPTLGLLMRF